MFTEKSGDLFETEARAIGHGVNCKGLMGKGIALEFRRRWPTMYAEYRSLCVEGLLKPGQIYPYRDLATDITIVNIASQEHPGPDATYEWLDAGIRNALAFCYERKIPSLAIPRIGCGIGGLEWGLVEDLLSVAAGPWQNAVCLEVWTP